MVHAVAFIVALQQNKALLGDHGITPARDILNQAQERGRYKQERRVAWRKLLQERRLQQQQQSSSSSLSSSRLPPPIVLPVRDGIWGILARTKVMRALGECIDNSRRLSRLREVLWYRSDRLDRPITSLLWLAKNRETHLDPWLDGVALAGLICSMVVFALGAANVPLMFALWLCQRSLMSVGGPWYGYGWEPQVRICDSSLQRISSRPRLYF
jgi:hypothetical protein